MLWVKICRSGRFGCCNSVEEGWERGCTEVDSWITGSKVDVRSESGREIYEVGTPNNSSKAERYPEFDDLD